MDYRFLYTSLCRIADLADKPFNIQKLPRDHWATGDYVAVKILEPGGIDLQIELPSGRMRGIIGGDLLIGALGERFATLEATGTWKEVGEDLRMHVLTAAGLLGKLTSRSVFMPQMMEVEYKGHIQRESIKVMMEDFVEHVPDLPYETPSILFVGTSMSAGKTTSARIVTHLLKLAGLKVVGAKLTGAGRYKDILAIKDVGADAVFDFVNVGLPSSICPRDTFRKKVKQITNRMAREKADIAVIEIGASPLEPYNGDLAIQAVSDQIKCVILSASDPYAVYGLMKAFDIVPNIVTGKSTNTLAGQSMVNKLCGVPAINMIDPVKMPEIRAIISKSTGFNI
jgi:hypothetical protein